MKHLAKAREGSDKEYHDNKTCRLLLPSYRSYMLVDGEFLARFVGLKLSLKMRGWRSGGEFEILLW